MVEIGYKEYVLPEFNDDEILRYCGVKTADERFLQTLALCKDELKSVLSPRVCYTLLPVTITDDGVDFSLFSVNSKHLKKNLNGCKSAVVFVASVGLGVDRLIAKYGKISPVKALCMQAIGSERAEALAEEVCKGLKAEYRAMRPRFSPGYGDLPLTTQRDIFTLLNCQKVMGVGLTEECLMTPSKSISAFVGVIE